MGSVSLRNLAKRNEYPICVRNIEGHIAPQHTVWNQTKTNFLGETTSMNLSS